MIKVTIQSENGTEVFQGEMAMGSVISSKGDFYGVRGFLVGEIEPEDIPSVLAKTAVNQIVQAYDSPAEQANALILFQKQTEREVRKAIESQKEAILEDMEAILKQLRRGM